MPHQVPAADRWFVNRRAELTALDAADEPGGGTRVTLLTGARGVGKTALVRQWAAAATGRFPGGELYVDLTAMRAPSGDNVAIGEALAECLRGLGVAEAHLPTTLVARTNLFRTRTATTPVLVVLDDVGQPAHVTPLIPTAPGSMVVATCDRRLEELVGLEGADLHLIEPLSAEHGRALLTALCPAQVADADPAVVRDLVDLCGGLPIALRVAAARLRTDRGLRVTDLVEEIRSGLDALSLGEHTSVTAVFTTAYRALPADARRAYRVFGAANGLELTGTTAAVALDVPPRTAGTVLSALLTANLIEELPGRRYRWYSLTARHAAEQANVGADGDVEPALRRLVHHYLLGAMTADVTVMGERLRFGQLGELTCDVPTVDVPAVAVAVAGAGKAEALRWLAEERHNLLHTVRLAVRLGDDESAWRLSEALSALYLNQRHPSELVQACTIGISAALRLGRRDVAARLRCVASRGLIDLGRFTAARTHLDAALEYAANGDHPLLLASVWEFRGRLADAEEDRPGAIAAYTRSLHANETIGEARGAAIARYFLACALAADGRSDEALALLSAATRVLRELGDERMAARGRLATGLALANLDRDREAVAVLREAVAVFAGYGTWHYEVQGLQALARVAGRLGETAEARAYLTRALRIVDETDPRVPDLRAGLAALPNADAPDPTDRADTPDLTER